jgi:hypothetical protein
VQLVTRNRVREESAVQVLSLARGNQRQRPQRYCIPTGGTE